MLQRSATDLAALSNRGYAFRKLGKFAAASEDYTAALKQSPGTVRLYNNRGYCLAKLGKYKSAIQDYQKVIQLDPANAHAYHNRCVAGGSHQPACTKATPLTCTKLVLTQQSFLQGYFI